MPENNGVCKHHGRLDERTQQTIDRLDKIDRTLETIFHKLDNNWPKSVTITLSVMAAICSALIVWAATH